MAVLSDADRQLVTDRWMGEKSDAREPTSGTKLEARQLVNAIDDQIDAVFTTINAGIPTAIRNKFTLGEKLRAFRLILRRRFGE